MPANIIACPSCGKKFKLPAGAKPDKFQCTGCGESIPLGGRPAGGRHPRTSARRRERKDSNTGIYIGLGVVGLIIIGAIVGVIVSGGDEEKSTSTATMYDTDPVAPTPPPRVDPGGGRRPVRPADPIRPPPRDPDPVPEPDPDPDPPVRRPDPEPEKPKTTDIRLMKWAQIGTHVAKYGHLESTSAGLRGEIDRLVTVLMDFQSGRDGLDAQNRLVEIGKPAVPMLLKAVGHLRFESIEDRSAGYLVDQAIRKITRHTRGIALKPMLEDSKIYKQILKYHVAWWERRKHLEGEAFPEPLADEPIEEDDEEDG